MLMGIPGSQYVYKESHYRDWLLYLQVWSDQSYTGEMDLIAVDTLFETLPQVS